MASIEFNQYSFMGGKACGFSIDMHIDNIMYLAYESMTHEKRTKAPFQYVLIVSEHKCVHRGRTIPHEYPADLYHDTSSLENGRITAVHFTHPTKHTEELSSPRKAYLQT